MKITRISAILALLATPSLADQPMIKTVTSNFNGTGWDFSVTLSHPDTGWDHYTDGWKILDANGRDLGMRTLMHPHINEQPFTRSLSGVVLPEGTQSVFVQAHCLVDGWGHDLFEVVLDLEK